jgi:hypothetical protein
VRNEEFGMRNERKLIEATKISDRDFNDTHRERTKVLALKVVKLIQQCKGGG